MNFFDRTIRSTRVPGGLNIQNEPYQDASKRLSTNQQFVSPLRIDHRDLCIYTSDQKDTPHCAGYATAGFIEIKNWQTKHYPEQINADKIYQKAKQSDNDGLDGTTLESATRAAIELGLFSGTSRYIDSTANGIRYAVHAYGACIAGFRITDEWNSISIKNGKIADYGQKAVQLGGHAVLVCGYDVDGVYIQNSWGTGWGIHGFAIVPWKKVSTQFIYGMVLV